MAEAWSPKEQELLRQLRIEPVRHPREKLVALVHHFKGGGGVSSVADRGTPVEASQDFARKVRDLTKSGNLDWLLQDNPGIPISSSSTHSPRDIITLRTHYEALQALLNRYHEALFARPVPSPVQIVAAGWFGEPLQRPVWESEPYWTSLIQHMQGAEAWELLREQAHTWGRYVDSCRQLAHQLEWAVRGDAKLRAELGVDQWLSLSEAHRVGWTEELLQVLVVNVVQDMQLVDLEGRLLFVRASPSFQANLPVPRVRVDYELDVYMTLKLGKPQDPVDPGIEEALRQLAKEQVQSNLWQAVREGFSALIWNPAPGTSEHERRQLLRSDRLANIIANSRCNDCRLM